MTTPRLTLSGRAERVPTGDSAALKARYAERFPKSKLYLSLPDALLYRIRAEAVQLNGGPAQNANAVTPQDLLTDLASASALMAEAPALVASLNEGDMAEPAGGSSRGKPGALAGQRDRSGRCRPEHCCRSGTAMVHRSGDHAPAVRCSACGCLCATAAGLLRPHFSRSSACRSDPTPGAVESCPWKKPHVFSGHANSMSDTVGQ